MSNKNPLQLNWNYQTRRESKPVNPDAVKYYGAFNFYILTGNPKVLTEYEYKIITQN